jgi:hypothetical protein
MFLRDSKSQGLSYGGSTCRSLSQTHKQKTNTRSGTNTKHCAGTDKKIWWESWGDVPATPSNAVTSKYAHNPAEIGINPHQEGLCPPLHSSAMDVKTSLSPSPDFGGFLTSLNECEADCRTSRSFGAQSYTRRGSSRTTRDFSPKL